MENPTPLSSNEKALAISVLVLGALVVLFSITTIAGAVYVLTTGQVFGGDMSRSLSKLGPKSDPQVQDAMERQLALQAEVQKKWAPAQLATGGVYLLAVIGAMVFAGLALARGTGRKQLGQLAAVAAAVRIAEGLVTFLLTNDLMRGVTDTILAGVPKGGRGQMTAEKAEQMRSITSNAMAGVSAVSSGCMTFVMCGYFALVAYVFLARRPPAAPAPPA